MKTVHFLALAAVLVLTRSGPALADTLLLADGGKVDGTIDEVILLQNGEEKKFSAGKFTAVRLDPKGQDVVQVDAKTAETGGLVSVRVRSVGGLLTFKRAELTAIAVGQAGVDELLKQYNAKRAEVKDDDAAGLYELAQWCRDNNLRMQARDLGELCLKTNPKPELEVLVHRFLGHVLKDGKWVVPEMQPPPDDTQPVRPTPQPEPGTTKVDPALAALGNKLAAEYGQKAADTRSKDREAVKTTYEAKWTKVLADLKKAKDEYDQATRRKKEISDDIAAERRRIGYSNVPTDMIDAGVRQRIVDLQREYDKANEKAGQLESTIVKARREEFQLASKIKSALSDASSRADSREQRVSVAKSRVERLLLTGGKPTEAEMRAIYDEAMKDKS